MGFRPSEYFGAIAVEELEDGIGDPKIDCKPNIKRLTRFQNYLVSASA